MTVLAKLRSRVRPIAMTLFVIAAMTAGAPFSALAQTAMASTAAEGEHCAEMSRDIGAEVGADKHRQAIGHLHSSDTHRQDSHQDSHQGSCCETDCHCPSIAASLALSPYNAVTFGLAASAPEYPPAPVLNGCRPAELLRPPI